jgi:hypothetical protein
MFVYFKLITKIFLLSFVVVFMFSCGSANSSIYNSDYPLTSEVANSQSGNIKVKIPQGWFTAQDNENNIIDLWLVKDDYSANLQFIQLNPDSLTRNEISSDPNVLVSLSKDFKRARYGKALNPFTNEEKFQVNNNVFFAYQYLDANKKNIRVVVFEKGNKYYELTAVPNKTNDNLELYRIQNSVLSSID